MPLDLKATLNLPKTDFSMKANLPQNEPKMLDTLGEDADLRPHPRGAQGAADLRPARRPAVCQRADPPGHGAQQDAEGFRREVAQHERLRCALCARLGLPRTAHRDQGRRSAGPQEARHGSAGGARGVPQVRAEVSRPAALAVQATRRLRPLGASRTRPWIRSTRASCWRRSTPATSRAWSTRA